MDDQGSHHTENGSNRNKDDNLNEEGFGTARSVCSLDGVIPSIPKEYSYEQKSVGNIQVFELEEEVNNSLGNI